MEPTVAPTNTADVVGAKPSASIKLTHKSIIEPGGAVSAKRMFPAAPLFQKPHSDSAGGDVLTCAGVATLTLVSVTSREALR